MFGDALTKGVNPEFGASLALTEFAAVQFTQKTARWRWFCLDQRVHAVATVQASSTPVAGSQAGIRGAPWD